MLGRKPAVPVRNAGAAARRLRPGRARAGPMRSTERPSPPPPARTDQVERVPSAAKTATPVADRDHHLEDGGERPGPAPASPCAARGDRGEDAEQQGAARRRSGARLGAAPLRPAPTTAAAIRLRKIASTSPPTASAIRSARSSADQRHAESRSSPALEARRSGRHPRQCRRFVKRPQRGSSTRTRHRTCIWGRHGRVTRLPGPARDRARRWPRSSWRGCSTTAFRCRGRRAALGIDGIIGLFPGSATSSAPRSGCSSYGGHRGWACRGSWWRGCSINRHRHRRRRHPVRRRRLRPVVQVEHPQPRPRASLLEQPDRSTRDEWLALLLVVAILVVIAAFMVWLVVA